jgi:hypothetical protein
MSSLNSAVENWESSVGSRWLEVIDGDWSLKLETGTSMLEIRMNCGDVAVK